MDIALKQRLVGAVVLVALGVIFIPMLLDGSSDAQRNHHRIDIPEPDRQGLETRLLPVNPALQAPQQAQLNRPQQNRPAPSDNGSPNTSEVERIVVTTRPEVVEPVSQPLTVDNPPDTQSEKADPPAQIPAQQPASASTAGTSWVVQLGSFGKAANAEALVKKMKEAGYAGYSEKVAVGAKDLHRVRVGPYASKSSAAEAGAQIGKEFSGIDVSVRTLNKRIAETTAESLAGWMVQVGSFGSQANAEKLLNQLRNAGYPAHLVVMPNDKNTAYKVRVGPAISRQQASKTQARLHREFELNGLVVSHP